MSDQGSILVLSSSNLEDVKLGDYFPTANVSTVMGPNNTVVPNPFPQIPSVLPPTSYFTRLTKRDLTVNEKAQTVRDFFELEGPPPTELTVQVDTKFLNLHVRSFNNQVQVYLTKYLLDCVWRDAATPTGPNGNLTANAGTSTSQRVRVYLFAGNPSSRESVRLLNIPMFRDGDNDPDFIIHRNQACVYEKSHNPYHPNLNLSSDLYFENQYTQQTETFEDPGFYLGTIHPQAIQALQRMREITIRWETDRAPEFPSPFWDAKFLRGSSVWNPTTSEFEIQKPEYRYNVYFQRVNTASLAVVSGNTVTGGPYFPLTLYTLADPINLGVAPFINNPNSTLLDVKDPKDGEICPLNHEDVTLRVGQMAIGNTTALGQVKTLNLRKMAPSDKDAFQVPIFNATSGNTELLTVYDRSSATIPPRYAVSTTPAGNASLHFPNGEWRGQPMSSGNTSVVDWKSPFPWEQSLTSKQLSVLNEKSAYETSANVQILNAHKYLFMDPGTAWNEHGGNVTIGERSLQFDFGTDRDFMINKFQLIFPKSQEDHQPYRIEASMQKAFKDTADQVRQDVQSTFWMGGVQFSKLTGSRDSPEEYRYLNTHSQTNAGLDGSYTQLWDVRSRQVGSSFTSPSSVSANVEFATSLVDTRGRANVVLPSSTTPNWYKDGPNEINPALDFQRQEFGPFTRGCTMAELKDTDKCKAWTNVGSVALTRPVETGNTFFFDLLNYMSSSEGSQELGYSVYVRASVNGSLLSESGNSNWLSVTTSSTGDRFAAVERGNVHTYFDGTWTLRPAFALGVGLNYTSISSSGSGNVLMAAVGGNAGGSVFVSTDRGNTRIELSASIGASQAGSQLWQDVTLAADGLTGLAVSQGASVGLGGHVYKYSAGGGILTQRVNISSSAYPEFIGISASQTGNVMAAITARSVYVNIGNGWEVRNPPVSTSEIDGDFNPWKAVTVSADGTRIVAVPELGFVLFTNFSRTSPTAGTFSNWSTISLSSTGSNRKTWGGIVFRGGYNMTGILEDGRFLTYENGAWNASPSKPLGTDWDVVVMASSANGQNMIAAVYYGSVWMSANNGTTWIKQTTIPPMEEGSVAISANGLHAAAVLEDGYIYLFKPDTNTNTNTWKKAESAGSRGWKSVGVSENGQYMYAAVDGGYIYGSTDFGDTWMRDVSPGSYKYWTGIVVRGSGGSAVTDDGFIFQLNIGSSTSVIPTLLSKTTILQAWRSVDSSNDGEIAVAVVYGGNVHTSNDSGETWTSQPNPGVRSWIGVTVSENGKRRVALSENGYVAISSTSGVAFNNLSSWTVDPTPTAPQANHKWSSIDSSDDFSVLLATQTSIDGTSDTGRVYVSGWDDATNSLKPWVLDTRLAMPARWNSVAMTRDGKRAIAGAMSKTLFILDSGDIWKRLTNSDTASRALATKIGPKARTKTATSLPPDTILNSEYEDINAYASLFGEKFDEPVYDYVFDNYEIYLVDCTRQATSTISGQMLLEEADGQIFFYDREKEPPVTSLTIAVGQGTDTIAYSSDGVTWTGIGSSIFTSYGRAVAWNGTRWVAVGAGTNTIAYSSDGITWTGIGSSIFTFGRAVAWNGTRWVAVGQGTNTIAYSSDGITWTGIGSSIFTSTGRGVAWNETRWVAVGEGTNTIAYSSDGITWTGIGSSIFTLAGRAVAWNETRWVAVGAGTNTIAYSSDGITWTGIGTSVFTNLGLGVAWNGSLWVAVGEGTNTIAYSSDGISWTGIGTSIFSTRSYGVAWSGTRWVAVGQGTNSIAYSSDGITWTGIGTSTFSLGYGVAWNREESRNRASEYPGRRYSVRGTLAPALDYIVKESYFFAPKYDQYDTLESTTFGGSVNVFDPRNSTRAQKMVNPSLGVGRYFGVAFGSFLYDGATNNNVYTRGPGNAMKLFSFRPLTQLFSFKSNCGTLKDQSGKATTLATFKNTVVKGMLQNVELVTSGEKYVDKDLTPYIHPTLDETEEGMYYDAKTGTFADTPMFLLTGAADEIVKTASNATVDRPRHAQVTYTMADDTTIPEVLDFYRASDKTALRRSAEFHLRVLSSTYEANR